MKTARLKTSPPKKLKEMVNCVQTFQGRTVRKSGRLKWIRHVAGMMVVRNAHGELVEEHFGKYSLRKRS